MTDPERAVTDAFNRLYRNCDTDQLEWLGNETLVRGIALLLKAKLTEEQIAERLYRYADDLATRGMV